VRSVRRAFVVVLVVLCIFMMINPVNAGTTSSSFIDWTQDYVEVESNLHDPADKGTHSAFANMQALDLANDTLTEADQGAAGNNIEDFVDTISDLHPEDTDIGTHAGGGFTEMQDKDGVWDTLTEADTGGAGGTVEYIAEFFNDTYSTFTDPTLSYDGDWGTATYETTAVTTDYRPVAYWTSFDSANSGSGTITQVDFIIRYSVAGTSNDEWGWIMVVSGTDHTLRAEASGDFSLANDTYTDITEPNGDGWTWAEVWSIQIDLDYDKVANSDNFDIYIYEMCVKVTTSAVSNYDLDLEVGWTTADYDETTGEELCVFGGTQGSEALRVDVWDTDWVNVISDVAVGWNNVSVASYLTDATFEIRFTDTSDEAVEADTWQVEGVLLHCWTDGTTDYELDLEVGWTVDTDYDETVEELCIFAGPQNAEALKVDVWDGAWTNVIADLVANQWNNVSISSYLTGVAFEIRFIDADQADDASQGTWEIDAVLIRVYSYAYVRTDYEAVDISEIESTASDFARSYDEVFALSEVESFAVDFARVLDEAIDLNETYSRALALVRVYEEAFVISEVVAPSANFALILLEALGIAALLTTRKSIVQAMGESISASEIYGTAAVLVRPFGESIGVSETFDRTLVLVRYYYDVFDLSEMESIARVFERVYYEGIGLSELEATAVGYGKFLYDSITVAAARAMSADFVKNMFESITAVATLEATKTGGEEYIKELFESIVMGADRVTAASLIRVYYDAFVLSEIESVARVFERIYYESIGLSDVEVTAVEFARLWGESLILAAERAFTKDMVRTLFESIVVAITLEATEIGGIDYKKYLSDQFALGDSVVAAGSFIRNFFEGITLAEFNENVRGFYKVLFESIVVMGVDERFGIFVRCVENGFVFNRG